jgi:hypothetical protein
VGLETGAARLTEASRLGIPLIARLEPTPGASPDQAAAEVQTLVGTLAPRAALLSLSVVHLALAAGWTEGQWQSFLHLALDAVGKVDPPRPLLLCVPPDLDIDKNDRFLGPVREASLAGWLVDGCLKAASGWVLGLPARAPALEQVRRLRQRWGDAPLLIAAGGVHEPEDALRFEAAGANLVQVATGLIYSGPGLPKRINDALLYRRLRSGGAVAGRESSARPAEMTWCWTALLGAGMLVGGLLALAIAATRVVLPYDEHFVGMSRELLERVNPRLMAFMAHDRISLAGTMLAIGLMYLGLSLYGVRRGLHWARQAIFWSAFTGFISFFLFLGFGYLDPFHAFVTTVLLQLLLLGVHSRLGTFVPTVAPPLRGDRAWRRSLWGQLLLIIHGAALLAAGLTISVIGATSVFVVEDLHFMQTTAEALRAANPRLVPLVAHDRATFGGMLLAAGWAFLLPCLWGFRNGSAWLWWTLLVAGLCAYGAAIGVHYAVGYTELAHLVPVFAGLALFGVGLALSYSYLCGGEVANSPVTSKVRLPV